LWRTDVRTGRGRAWIALVQAFAAAVLLHALWDTTDRIAVRLLLALVGTTLLAAQIRRVARPDGGERRLDQGRGVTARRPARASGPPRC
jgi:hypothetical protein